MELSGTEGEFWVVRPQAPDGEMPTLVLARRGDDVGQRFVVTAVVPQAVIGESVSGSADVALGAEVLRSADSA